MEFLENLLGIIAVVVFVIAVNARNKAQRGKTQAPQDPPPAAESEGPAEGEWSEYDAAEPREPDIPDISHEGACAFSPEGGEPPEHDHGGIRPQAEDDEPVYGPRLTAAKVREAFILSEVLAPPVSMRRRPNQ